MSATGTITLVEQAEASNASFFGVLGGKTLVPCWRLWIRLDDPRALADPSPTGDPHEWLVDLPRNDNIQPCSAGDRISVSTHGKRDVTIAHPSGTLTLARALVPGVYSANRVG